MIFRKWAFHNGVGAIVQHIQAAMSLLIRMLVVIPPAPLLIQLLAKSLEKVEDGPSV